MSIVDNPLDFTSKELLKSVRDHEKAVKIGLAAGPNIGYVRTHQRAAWAMRIVAEQLKDMGQ